MKTSKLLAFAASCAAMVCLYSCSKESNDDSGNGNGNKEPEPGVTVADVLFSAENGDYCYYVTPDGSAEAVLAIIRDKATDEAEYAIKVVSADEGIEVPSSVKFAKGATSSSITVKAPASGKVGDVYSFELMLTGDNVNSSANSTAGTLRCEGSFYFYEEITGVSYFSGAGAEDYLGYIAQTAWKIDARTIILKDFLGNGHDLKVIYDESGNVSQLVYDYYNLYVLSSDGYDYSYFYSDEVEAFADNEGYEVFAPKGEGRTITTMSLYTDPGYAVYQDESQYLYISVPEVQFYVKDGDKTKVCYWTYLCFKGLSDEDLAKYDLEGFPELPDDKSFPTPVYDETEYEGYVNMYFYLWAEETYLDTQYAVVVDGNYVIEDFMRSGCTLTLKPDGTTFSIEVLDKDGNVVSDGIEEGYQYLGIEFLYPWVNGDSDGNGWAIWGLYRLDDVNETGWDEENKEAYFIGNYYVYDGTSYLANSEDYISIYW